jgi:hypothetical protein
MTETYTCKAEEMLMNAGVIEVDGYLIHNWELDCFENDSNDVVLNFSYTNDEGLIFEFEFTVEELKNADVKNNIIVVKDTQGQEAELGFYKLVPLV